MPEHIFIFTSGEYDGYGLGAICACDHPVTEKEWQSHLQQYRDARASRQWDAQGYPSWEAWYDAGRHGVLQRWEKRNVPEVTFRRLHRMRVLSVTVLHNNE